MQLFEIEDRIKLNCAKSGYKILVVKEILSQELAPCSLNHEEEAWSIVYNP